MKQVRRCTRGMDIREGLTAASPVVRCFLICRTPYRCPSVRGLHVRTGVLIKPLGILLTPTLTHREARSYTKMAKNPPVQTDEESESHSDPAVESMGAEKLAQLVPTLSELALADVESIKEISTAAVPPMTFKRFMTLFSLTWLVVMALTPVTLITASICITSASDSQTKTSVRYGGHRWR
jgi:hypothetical protein